MDATTVPAHSIMPYTVISHPSTIISGILHLTLFTHVVDYAEGWNKYSH
jgi:hypothetical protein